MTPDLPAPKTKLVPPSGLSRAEKAAWSVHAARLRAVKLESGVDAGALEALVKLYCRARDADAIVAVKGLTMESGANGEVRRPEVAISRECWRDYTTLCGQFGLTPAARAKVGGDGKAPEGAGDVPAELSDASGGS